MAFLLGSPSGSLPLVRSPEVMKFFIMPYFLSLCLMGYTWFRTRCLEDSLEVVYRRPHPVLEAAFGGRDILLVRVVCFPVIVIIAADNNCNSLRVPLSHLFATLGTLLGT
jgi:hypothetical protein